jgi:hypothetical protein
MPICTGDSARISLLHDFRCYGSDPYQHNFETGTVPVASPQEPFFTFLFSAYNFDFSAISW